jgi:hypothetical protein
VVIGADGIGTAFGNSETGIVDGPLAFNWRPEESRLQLRAEFYNALNHPEFANPDANFTSPTFAAITNTSVNSRVGQLALRVASLEGDPHDVYRNLT